ncbi:MAG TPA: glycosyltransferase [Gammaproteobacteria bacterium]|nr:glycosyltransferase [Gammaproteobacteria bacterium]
MTTKILAIFTLFHPEQDRLENLIKNSLAYSGCDVFLSDNAEFSSEMLNNSRITYHNNKSNLGLGAAQNIGLKFAQEKNYDYVILFDQDSQIENNFIANIIQEFELARQKEPKLIAAGPFFNDAKPTQNVYRKMIIASGTIIYMPFLSDVGLMDELLFIDYVDTEWCHRARSKGYTVMKLAKVHMMRSIGHMKSLWFGWKLNYHNYNRYYYFFRNAIIMVKMKRLPLKSLLKLRNHIFKIPLLDHRWQRTKLMFKGIRDGLAIKV